MNSLSVDPLASVTEPNQPGDGAGRTFFKALLLASTLLSGGLATLPAHASLLITTTGTITGTSDTSYETGGLFGLPIAMTSLVGFSYTLIVSYDSLGSNYFSPPPPGTSASDVESFPGITGYVTAIINGHSLTTPVTDSLASLLSEDQFNFFGSNQGASSSGDNVNVTQLLACNFFGNPCIPFADLMAPVTYVPGPLDSSSDQYTFQGATFPATGTPTATFTGTEATFAFASVPEPASWVLLATGLLGLSIPVRRRQA